MLKHLFDSKTAAEDQRHPAVVHMGAPLPVRQGFMTISPELAARFLKEATFEGQRKTDAIYVSRHVENLRRGLWLDGSQIAFAQMGDKHFLINGKHRLTAVASFGKPAEFSIVVYQCADMTEVRSLYARFDNVQRSRSKNQIIAASDLPGQMGVAVGIATATYGAVPLLLNGLRAFYHNDPAAARLSVDIGLVDFRIAAAMAWAEQAKLYERCLTPAEGVFRKKLLVASVIAPALYTMKHAKQQALEFWGGVARNDGLRRGDPRHTFIQHILTANLLAKETGGGVAAVALAWNAFAEGRKLSILRQTSATKIAFVGTPMTGAR
jgi:hypothetical protein